MYPLFHIFGRTVGSYALCAMVGFAACAVLAWVLGRRKNITFEDILLLMLAAAGGLTLGGHLLYGITNIGEVIDAVTYIGEQGLKAIFQRLSICFGGSVFYGGFIGGTLALLIYTRMSKSSVRADVLDIWAVSVPLFHTFGRIGCFLGGCCYGVESHIGFIVDDNTLVPEINGVRRFPVALTEAAFCLIIFLIILYVTNKGCMYGKRVYLYMLLYPPVRFVLEFFRGDAIRGFLFGLSTSQWISIILFSFSATMLLSEKYKSK